MQDHRRRLLPPTMLATAAVTAFAMTPAADAQVKSETVATATSTADDGMTYMGTIERNVVRVGLTGTTFTIDDSGPILAGAGCAQVPGDRTKVTCTAFKDQFGAFRRFTLYGNGADDVLINQTDTSGGISTSNANGAPMRAYGGSGHDELMGDDAVNDDLNGESGNDTLRGGSETGGNTNDVLHGDTDDDTLEGGNGRDQLFGNNGNDKLDGGFGGDRLQPGDGADSVEGGLVASSSIGNEDTVVFATFSPVTVDLRHGYATHGTPEQTDTISNVENIQGGSGKDWLTGDANANTIFGGSGDDTINGDLGRDRLFGDDGNDALIPSAVADGVVDFLDCDGFGGGNDDDDPFDLAFRYPADGDVTHDCEQVLDV